MPIKQHRLKSDDIKEVFKKGRRQRGSCLDLVWLEKVQPVPRIAIVASKKVSSKAVVRNKLRRVIREWFKKNKETIVVSDLLIIIKPTIITLENQDIRKKLEILFNRSHLLEKN